MRFRSNVLSHPSRTRTADIRTLPFALWLVWLVRTVDIRTSGFALVLFAHLRFSLLSGYHKTAERTWPVTDVIANRSLKRKAFALLGCGGACPQKFCRWRCSDMRFQLFWEYYRAWIKAAICCFEWQNIRKSPTGLQVAWNESLSVKTNLPAVSITLAGRGFLRATTVVCW